MSDCSTEAMKPKERLDTCGTCERGLRNIVTCWEKDPQGKHHAYNEPACDRYVEYIYPEAIEQRCKQLEQVAREIFNEYRKLLKNHMDICGRAYVVRNFKSAGEFCNELEALGVSVDD